MLSIAKSRLALPVQFSFLGIHGVGLLLSTIYTGKVPDLYPNNSHHKLGWIVTWIVVAQAVIGLLRLAVKIASPHDTSSVDERASFLPIQPEPTSQPHHYQRVQSPDPYRYSNDSGHFTASEPSRSHSLSSSHDQAEEEERKNREFEAAHADLQSALTTEKRGLLSNPKVERLASRIAAYLSKRTMRILECYDNLVNRLIFLLGFIAFISGMAVYGGVFVSYTSPH